jgi:predicted small lipoprotein YifL
MTRLASASLVLGAVLLLAACGQTGKLYLPEKQGEIVARPTQTPPPETSTDTGKPSNSPQTVDSPSSPDTPAPEVTAPQGSDPADEKNKKDGAKAPPTDSQHKN